MPLTNSEFWDCHKVWAPRYEHGPQWAHAHCRSLALHFVCGKQIQLLTDSFRRGWGHKNVCIIRQAGKKEFDAKINLLFFKDPALGKNQARPQVRFAFAMHIVSKCRYCVRDWLCNAVGLNCVRKIYKFETLSTRERCCPHMSIRHSYQYVQIQTLAISTRGSCRLTAHELRFTRCCQRGLRASSCARSLSIHLRVRTIIKGEPPAMACCSTHFAD